MGYRNPKICFIVYNLSIMRGDQRAAMMVANALAEECSVTVLSMLGERPDRSYVIDDRIECRMLNWPDKRLLAFRHDTDDVFRQLKDEGIETVFLEGTFIGYVFSRYRKEKGMRLIFCDHGALCNQRDIKTLLVRFFAARRSDMTVCLTDQNAGDYRRWFRIPPRKLCRIYNWMNASDEAYDPDTHRILSVGRLEEEKGFDLALDVAQKLLPVCPEWSWHVFGDGKQRAGLERLAQEKGLADRFVFEGATNSIEEEYRKSSLLILTSYREGLPLVLLEAMNFGLPMVSFDIATGPREIISDGENGFLVKPYDTDAMAEKAAEILRDRELRIRMSEMTGKDKEKFSREKILAQWRALAVGKTEAR